MTHTAFFSKKAFYFVFYACALNATVRTLHRKLIVSADKCSTLTSFVALLGALSWIIRVCIALLSLINSRKTRIKPLIRAICTYGFRFASPYRKSAKKKGLKSFLNPKVSTNNLCCITQQFL